MFEIISLFTGMGGIDIGFCEDVIVHRDSVLDDGFIEREADDVKDFVVLKRHPFKIVMQNDIMKDAKEICDLNNWSHGYALCDVREILADPEFTWPAADVVLGGFPCQPFSLAGKRQGMDCDKGTLYESFVDVVKRVQPKVFVAENVKGILSMKGALERICADFDDAGYDVTSQLIKCEEYGIPQTRHRVILIGLRKDLPRPDGEWHALTANKTGPIAISKYFEHLEEPDSTDDDAQRVYSKAAKLQKGQGQIEIALNQPGPTMRAEHHGNIEFRRRSDGSNGEQHLPERRLSVREAALIQTFPPKCVLTSERPSMKAYRPIGNAIPPLLGWLIADRVKHILTTHADASNHDAH